jgi:hypothetical protein
MFEMTESLRNEGVTDWRNFFDLSVLTNARPEVQTNAEHSLLLIWPVLGQ